ncbi:fimbrial protein [Ralstonia soli]|uniref:Fimbrial protein n=1 Tax=Ralstonia soli TaxID=2953896 RepID=A0ABT1AGQ3_9RALS|nr:fimbrial protein [Ralstonia soli]MCO5397575.1 fimbrial protein [Ralstonia soli]
MKIANHKRCLPQALAALLLIAGGATEVFAQTTTVNVTGNIVGTCAAGAASPDTLNFTLPDTQAATLTAAGPVTASRAAVQRVTVACSGNPGVRMTMSIAGTSPVPAQNVVPNTGTATQVGVQILYGAAGGATAPTVMPIGGTGVTFVGGAPVVIPISAQYYVMSANPNAGSVTATATLTFTPN